MSTRNVAGVDWAGGEWFAVCFENQEYDGCILESDFETLWDEMDDPDQVVIDVPIGLPADNESLEAREELDSEARSYTGRPSSVFPVPSRGTAAEAYEGEDNYDDVKEKNEEDPDKGLNKQSYHIAGGIGEVDAFLKDNEEIQDKIIESHPEVCFRSLKGDELEHSKTSAPGVGQRLQALSDFEDEPRLLHNVTKDLISKDNAEEVAVDDVLDAIVLGVVASHPKEELEFLEPEDWDPDEHDNFLMRMAYVG